MSKPRFTPDLTNYEANTAKGLCAYCGEPLTVDIKTISILQRTHRIHEACCKAILVLERMKPSQPRTGLTSSAFATGGIFVASASVSSLKAGVVTHTDLMEAEEYKVIERYFRNKEHQAP